jgi:hypothetical protein
MRLPLSACIGPCIGLVVLAIAGPGLAQDAGDSTRNWAAIAQCGPIGDDRQRLECMDAVLRAAGIIGPAAAPAEQARSGPSAASAAAQGVAPAAPAAPAAPRNADFGRPVRAEAQEMTTTIASVQTVGYQRVRVTTADGAVWEQTQAESFRTPPRVGDSFSIQPAAMGSFRCQFEQSSLYRCKRVD